MIQGDPGHDLVCPAGQAGQHLERLLLRTGLAEDTIIDRHGCVGADYRNGKVQICACDSSLGRGQPDNHVGHRLVIVA